MTVLALYIPAGYWFLTAVVKPLLDLLVEADREATR